MSRVTPKTDELRLPWSGPVRLLVSLWLIYHLLAILTGPLNLPPSIHGSAMLPAVLPYHRVLFLGHAYKFFAPDPGPSHLIECDIELADGSHVKPTFPDRHEQWPRLLYHRHFMLTEFVGNMEPGMPSDMNNFTWETAPLSDVQRIRVRGYADHLLDAYNGQRVTLTLVQHLMPTTEQITKEKVSLRDPRSYRRRPLGTFERGKS
ncbi:MAG: hypothetical protein JNM18_09070 [Planctomycetaceae bacterium]|nr:hypothetical protein [Planctomycetaceae bacterium]